MILRQCYGLSVVACLQIVLLGGCGGGSDSKAPTPTYTISGTVTGLDAGTQVTLLDNGGDSTMVTAAAGTFTFPTAIALNGAYAVTVATPPPNQGCVVSNGTGTATANMSNVVVACSHLAAAIYTFPPLGSGESPARVTLGSDGNFYGVSTWGGANGAGNVTKITPAGVATVLYSFKAAGDAANPQGALIQASDGNFYGTSPNSGGIFRITPAGVETVLYSFTGLGDVTGSTASLIQASDGNFYGTAPYGGAVNNGGVFKVTPAGVETVLYSFTGGSDATAPSTALIQASDGNFYGTTPKGGANGLGTVFKVTPAGVETVLYSFAGGSDGSAPLAALIQASDGNLYGTTASGGTSNQGTVFKVTLAGAETVLYSFAGGNDGGLPAAALIQASDGNLYGTTASGGASGQGTTYKLTLSGAEKVLYSFTGGTDGGAPVTPLIQAGNGSFYGTNQAGGANSNGELFNLTLSGTLSTTYAFNSPSNGEGPKSLVVGSDGTLYGITTLGGSNNVGTVFTISPSGVETVLHSFLGLVDGANPISLIQGSDGNLYGITDINSGPFGRGTVFKTTPAGAFTVLYAFSDATDGTGPVALIQGADGNLYGLSQSTVVIDSGESFAQSATVFQLTPAGVDTVIYSFPTSSTGPGVVTLIQGSDGNLYGTTLGGGRYGSGTVFRLTLAGVETVLYSFTGATDGAFPSTLLQGLDGNLYGTAQNGGSTANVPPGTLPGSDGEGTVFKLTLAGENSTLATFIYGVTGMFPFTLVQTSDGNLWGALQNPGPGYWGLFQTTTSGNQFIYAFPENSAVGSPNSITPGSDGNLYGTSGTTVWKY